LSEGLAEQKSGSELDKFILELVDKYSQAVGDANEGTLSVLIDSDSFDEDAERTPFLGGKTVFQVKNGEFIVVGLEFTGNPTDSYNLIFDSDAIDETKQSNKEYI